MPYFIYKIDKSKEEICCEKLACFASFKEAKVNVRRIRADLNDNDTTIARIIFADNPQEAEARLMEKRQAPILKEWEK